MTQKEAEDALALLSQELNVRGNLGECEERAPCMSLDYLPSLPPPSSPGVLTTPQFIPPQTHHRDQVVPVRAEQGPT